MSLELCVLVCAYLYFHSHLVILIYYCKFLCLMNCVTEYPQFGYDVLSKVLDEKAAREQSRKEHPAGRPPKRPRQSNA